MAEIHRSSPGRRPGPAARAYDRAIGAAALAVRSVSRLVRAGAGTSAPGMVLQRLDPGFVRRRSNRLPDGVTLVSGTNGKTTTAAMISHVLAASGTPVLANESGANLFRGVATTLATAGREERAAVFEVDEGALERLVPALGPRVLVLTNVFRDQLDRFGEPETVARLLGEAARALPEGSTVVANADDPLLWHAVEELGPVGFGVRAGGQSGSVTRIDGEPEVCPRCGGAIRYRHRTFAHLGAAGCARCGWSSADPRFVAEILARPGLDALRLSIGGTGFDVRLGGVHNAYNAAAAVAAASVLGVAPGDAARALESFTPRFGRTEHLEFAGRTLWVLLMKNPAGASALVDQVVADPRIRTAVVMLNDLWADGRDVSWIWDADLESLVRRGVPIVAGGIRAYDVAVRIKYAKGSVAATETDAHALLDAVTSVTEEGGAVAVLATYTAMLSLRRAVLGSRVAQVSELVS
ncbi:MAG: MurT ligase domain-containing protein [Actinomycetota bacterium]